jgi:4'-phosphopantetheinyl transferase
MNTKVDEKPAQHRFEKIVSSGTDAVALPRWAAWAEQGTLVGWYDVHVWRIGLDVSDRQSACLLATLATDEKARAEKFCMPGLARHYIAARGALRGILGRYLAMDPVDVAFAYEKNGKPVLALPLARSGGLRFNISHAQGLALCVVTRDRAVGVDVESCQREVEMDSIAERFFSPHECALLRSVPPGQRRELFFRYWTCKEALVKATGLGLSQLEETGIELCGNGTARVTSSAAWCLYELAPADGFRGAIAAEGRGHVLRFFQYAFDAVS